MWEEEVRDSAKSFSLCCILLISASVNEKTPQQQFICVILYHQHYNVKYDAAKIRQKLGAVQIQSDIGIYEYFVQPFHL